MSRFYASIRGSRGEATRQGTASSGITGHIRGLGVGVQVKGFNESGQDVFHVYMTGGSNAHAQDMFLGTVHIVDSEPKFTPED